MKPVDYDARQHQNYARGRAMSPATLRSWMDVFALRLPARRPLSGLDLGSGTGRLSPALASTFGPLVGVEPSARMRAHAPAHPLVRYLAGSAESIPLAAESVAYTVMYLSWHHVQDKPLASRELARVTRPGGVLFLRSQFSDRMPRLWWLEHFPRGYEVDAAMYDTVDSVSSLLASAGWHVEELTSVTSPSSLTRAEELSRLRYRTLSTFEQLTDEEIRVGFDRLERAVASAPDEPVPVYPEQLLVATRLDSPQFRRLHPPGRGSEEPEGMPQPPFGG
ncbi:class I SAM-dependent methyltransferase [Tenggerimyces flavus]|uniref:Class I SAM-dependent methyltransferase n=1 Tax=Tenggerimyces flavus TaxID=1708749 RepID=A0ABV7Y4V2_9ACTN|nr:class I SAM-dependent methyltransferase [Tenggerimyces flavus]MBM7788644.1 ubiquinone/menaquinone biosynthesis C-methylase UbiE [Tenggerimyces flavus]